MVNMKRMIQVLYASFVLWGCGAQASHWVPKMTLGYYETVHVVMADTCFNNEFPGFKEIWVVAKNKRNRYKIIIRDADFGGSEYQGNVLVGKRTEHENNVVGIERYSISFDEANNLYMGTYQMDLSNGKMECTYKTTFWARKMPAREASTNE
jgi:hypothetical protein